ncbi:MAG: pilin [Candidatus Daviesbacteria bacterium]|nr:pilin [Candidatus Daviesbacteria bacterium]
MKKAILINSLLLTALLTASPVFAQSADVSKVQNFIQNIIQVMVTLAGFVSVMFFVWGGFKYMTSSGNPESLDTAKKTIMYSAVGLAITLGAFVLSNIVTQLATSAFGGAH